MSPSIASYLDFIRAHAERERKGVAFVDLDPEIERHFSVVKCLPLFADMDVFVLRDILRGAHIRQCKKGDIFLTQNAPIEWFSILLDGWVKVFKTSAEGKESILHIVGRQEAILDADILHPTHAPASAQAICTTTLLAIPVSAMRLHLADTENGLTFNFLAALTKHAQKLAQQFEQITLRSAMQRVGWLFLNLKLDAKTDKTVTLPFDKATIAAWLGLEPPTFSRVLKKFAALGFIINRQKITMPHARALCAYCDAESAQRCPSIGLGACPYALFSKMAGYSAAKE